MNFRCYSCKLVMHDGPPPLEALSKVQTIGAGIAAPEVDYHTFDGTKFEGMSPYQFCTFCLTVYKEFPSMAMAGYDLHNYEWESNSMTWTEGQIAWQDVTCNICDEEIIRQEIDPSKGESFTLFDDCQRSRACILHSVKKIYPNADISQLEELFHIQA